MIILLSKIGFEGIWYYTVIQKNAWSFISVNALYLSSSLFSLDALNINIFIYLFIVITIIQFMACFWAY